MLMRLRPKRYDWLVPMRERGQVHDGLWRALLLALAEETQITLA